MRRVFGAAVLAAAAAGHLDGAGDLVERPAGLAAARPTRSWCSGSAQYNGVPSSIFAARLEHAQEAVRGGRRARSSSPWAARRPATSSPRPRPAATTWPSAGVPADALLAVPEGVDTLESMRAVAAAFDERGWHSAVLVTDPWHAMRAQRMAEDSGIEASSSPTRQGPAVQTRTTQFQYILRETAAYLLYRATGQSVAGAPGIG